MRLRLSTLRLRCLGRPGGAPAPTVRYLGIEVDVALEISEQTEI